MSKPMGFRVDKEQEKIVKRFKNALIRKYGQLYGVWSSEIVKLMENYLEVSPGPRAHTKPPSRFTSFHRRLAKIYFELPNDVVFRDSVVDRLVERHAGGDDRTKRRYWNALEAWELLVLAEKKKHVKGYTRRHLSSINQWIREAHQSARGGERVP